MKKIKIIALVLTSLFIVACTPRPEINIPMPKKVKDFSGYASGKGLTSQFKITSNGMVMKYNDVTTGTIILMRDKNAPIFRGQYRDGVKISASAYGNAKTSARVNDIEIIYAYGYPYMGVKSPKHYIEMTNIIIDTKQNFSAWHKQVDKLFKK